MNKILQFTKFTEINLPKRFIQAKLLQTPIASEDKSSKIWTVINQLVSKNKRSTTSIMSPLKVDGKLITDSKDISIQQCFCSPFFKCWH